MLKIAKTAAFILVAMAPVLVVAQRSQGRSERKPSPSSSATPAPVPQSAIQTAPGSQQFVTSQNYLRANARSNAGTPPPASPQSLVRPTPHLQALPAELQVVAPAPVVASVPSPAAQSVVNPAPSPEATASVHYAQGQLTVISQAASLGAVLKLISAKTGALVDISPELQNEPVIAQVGPGPAREVLTGLLDSPRIDYIIMGSGGASGSLERIVVRTRQSFARTAMAAGPASQPHSPDVETEVKLDQNGSPAISVRPAAARLTQEQLMENWKKVREEKRLAEIEQQQRDRENEKNQVQVEPQPQAEPQPDNAPTENPPFK